MNFLKKITDLIDWFIPVDSVDLKTHSEKQNARMIIIAGFLGLLIPIIMVENAEEYPKRYMPLFGFLWALSVYAIISFRLLRTTITFTGAICSLGLTIMLIGFNLYNEILFSGTYLWYTVAVLLSTVLVNLKWGFLNFFILLSSTIVFHHLYGEKELILPPFWSYKSWINNLKVDQILSLIVNTLMISFFLYTKKKSEQELISSQKTILKQQENLFKESRMAELGKVSGGFAHEINNPMTVILANAQKIKKIAKNENIDKEKLLYMVEKIEKTGGRVQKIIDGLKHYTRDASKDPFEFIDVDDLLKDINEIFQENIHQEEIQLTIKNDIEKDTLYAIHGKVFQILVNLINNAIYALKKHKNKKIDLHCYEKDKNVIISLMDNGDGIPKDLENNIFQPFFTTKPIGQGTGLGLSISYSLMEDLNGEIKYSRNNKKTYFTLTFPKKDSQ